MRVLVVEDDPLLGDALCVGLRQRGFTTDWIRDGLAAQLALDGEPFAAMVLDLGLPRLSGMELLRDRRERGDAIPATRAGDQSAVRRATPGQTWFGRRSQARDQHAAVGPFRRHEQDRFFGQRFGAAHGQR